MKKIQSLFGIAVSCALLAAPMAASAQISPNDAQLIGAAVGAAMDKNPNTANNPLLRSAAAGVLGLLLNQNNANYYRDGYYGNRYYYGGREFRNRADYEAYREAVRRQMLQDREMKRYQEYMEWRRNRYDNRDEVAPGNSAYGHQQWKNGRGHYKHNKYRHSRGYRY